MRTGTVLGPAIEARSRAARARVAGFFEREALSAASTFLARSS
jgi:hypothetical protein